MKQFIRYLYEYQGGKPVRNTGFVRVEEQPERCAVQIHGKGMQAPGGAIDVYLFYRRGAQCVGILQGKDSSSGPSVNYQFSYGAEDIGRAEGTDSIRGVILEDAAGRKYAAVWDNEAADIEHMIPEDAQTVTQEEPAGVPPVEEQAREEQITAPVRCEKIRRQDIARLPRREWRLANNSFLLHGYYNYHHLLLIEEDGCLYLGVPGIYHPREETAARAFGFRSFRKLPEDGPDLSEQEKDDTEKFGYWCRQVERLRT